MKKFLLPVSAVLLASTLTACNQTVTTDKFSASQQKAIEKIVKNYIINHPEILVEAGKTLRQREMTKMLNHAKSAAAQQADKLVNDPISPIAGNKSGKVTVIEFYDYQCAVCHQQAPIMEKLVKEHPDVRFIFRQLPIFGSASQYAAQVAIDAYKQDKFIAFNKKLFDAHIMEGQLTDKAVNDIAKSVGVTVPKKADADDQDTAKQYFSQGVELARALGFPGTPGIVVMPTSTNPDGDKITAFLGYSSLDDIEAAIKKAQ